LQIYDQNRVTLLGSGPHTPTQFFSEYSPPPPDNNAKLREYKVNFLDDTSDFVSPDDFDGVEVILEQS